MSCPCSQPKSVSPSDCDLECKHKGFKYHKKKFLNQYELPSIKSNRGDLTRRLKENQFIGPVRVILVRTPIWEYIKKIVWSGLVILAFILIGATVIPMFYYSLSLPLEPLMTLHILLFTAGLLLPSALLTMNTYNGSMMILKHKHRKEDYIVLKLASLTCIIGGLLTSCLSMKMKLFDFSGHSLMGLAAIMLCFLDLCTYSCSMCRIERICPKLGLMISVPGFFVSSICFITGLMKPVLKTWLPLPEMPSFLTLFCVFYTCVTVWNPIANFVPVTRSYGPGEI